MNLNRRCHAPSLAFSLLAFGIFAADAPQTTQHKDEMKAIGCFANVRSNGEHADGYSVQLWFRGSGLVGLIDYHSGLLGDPPMGTLTDVRYDSSTGKLSFKAKLTSGLHYCREHNGVPSHDLLRFQGFLKADRVEGKIVLADQSDSAPRLVDTREKFLMRKDDNCSLESYESYDAWWRDFEPIYKSRGAKW